MSDPIARLNAALEGRYSVERELGEGGMATVYLAFDLKHERRVALKVMKPDLAAAVGAERFLSEIKTTANLQHPHILPLHDSGDADGALFYVMPYVQGETLRERLERERQLPVEVALQIASAVGGALDYAHRNGVVHRDIKPSNILLQDGEPIVGDFGIALVAAAGDETRLTRSGMSLGTSHYMSPEQASGEVHIGPASDIYSLACVLYEMLSGDPPHTGSPQAVLAKMLTQKPVAVREIRDTVPASVDAAISKALARVPADRFVTANDFVQALSGAATDHGVGETSVPSGEAEPGRAEWTFAESGRRRRWWVAVSAMVVVAGVGQQLYRGRASPLDDRAAVVGFIENQTGDPTLDPLAALAASSITEGLTRTGVVDVIPSATATQTARLISREIEAGEVLDPVAALAARTGASLVVSGNFFKQTSDLVFHLQVMDAARDTLLLALEPVHGSSAAPGDVIDAVRERLMGALSILFDDRIVLQAGAAMYPPTYAAYQAFSSGLTAFQRSECAAAMPHFSRASELDSTFVAPLLYASYCLGSRGTGMHDHSQLDSLLILVAGHGERLTPYESESLAYKRALMEGDLEGAYRAISRAAAFAPGSFAEYQLAEAAMSLFRPAEAVRLLEGLDLEGGPMEGWFPYWLLKTWALHMLRDHEAELEAAREARRLYPDDMIPVQMEVSALAALHRLNEIDDVIAEAEVMLRRAERLSSGLGEFPDLLRRAGEELRGHGHEEKSVALFERALEWYEGLTSEEIRSDPARLLWYGICLYHVDRAREAITVFDELILGRDGADEPWHHGNAGVAAAIAGDTVRADAELEWLDGYESEFEGGLREWLMARVTARLGRAEEAVRLMNEAVRRGHAGGGWWLHTAIDFAPLIGYAPFEEFARPKG